MEQFNIKTIIADNIKFYREQKGLQKKDVAKYVGVTAASVTHWEDGSNSIDINKLAVLCNLFECTLSEMVTSRDSISPSVAPDEQQLLTNYRRLNNTGKSKAQEYVEDLTCNPKYTREQFFDKESQGA